MSKRKKSRGHIVGKALVRLIENGEAVEEMAVLVLVDQGILVDHGDGTGTFTSEMTGKQREVVLIPAESVEDAAEESLCADDPSDSDPTRTTSYPSSRYRKNWEDIFRVSNN